MMAEPRLFPVPHDIALFTLAKEGDYWRLAVRTGVARGRWMEDAPQVYEGMTLPEASDVIAAVLDGIQP